MPEQSTITHLTITIAYWEGLKTIVNYITENVGEKREDGILRLQGYLSAIDHTYLNLKQ